MFCIFIYFTVVTDDHAEGKLTKCHDLVAFGEFKATWWRSIYRVFSLRSAEMIYKGSKHLALSGRHFANCCKRRLQVSVRNLTDNIPLAPARVNIPVIFL